MPFSNYVLVGAALLVIVSFRVDAAELETTYVTQGEGQQTDNGANVCTGPEDCYDGITGDGAPTCAAANSGVKKWPSDRSLPPGGLFCGCNLGTHVCGYMLPTPSDMTR